MKEKWTPKEVMEHAKQLKSPYDNVQQNPQQSIAEKIKSILGRRKASGNA